MKVSKDDINISVVQQIVDILNKGLSAEVKKEKDNIVVVELKRKALIKSPMRKIIISEGANDNSEGTLKNTKE